MSLEQWLIQGFKLALAIINDDDTDEDDEDDDIATSQFESDNGSSHQSTLRFQGYGDCGKLDCPCNEFDGSSVSSWVCRTCGHSYSDHY